MEIRWPFGWLVGGVLKSKYSGLYLGCELTRNRFSIFHFIKNRNWPPIGQRKMTPSKFKNAHQSRVNVGFDEMTFKSSDQSGANFYFWWNEKQKIYSPLIHALTAGWSYAQPRLTDVPRNSEWILQFRTGSYSCFGAEKANPCIPLLSSGIY